jgi:hypothetical protein
MSIYRFPQFNVDMTDPEFQSVAARYAIGDETAIIEVTLSTAGAKLYGVTFHGFPNTDDWGDDDVLAWALEELEKYKVD